MNERTVDVAVIGAGTAGLNALRLARKTTENVVLIEGGPFGTTCARVGCMPSKLLIAAAGAAQHVRDAGTFGIRTTGMEIDGRAVMERVRAYRDRFVGHVKKSIDAMPSGMIVRGQARFDGDDRLVVEGRDHETVIRAGRTVIATGSSVVVPEVFHSVRHVTSDDIFEWEDLPESLAVFGGGIVGLELGQALARLGVRVQLFGKHGKVGPLTDESVVAAARDHFTSVMDFVPDHELVDISGVDHDVTVRYSVEGATFSSTFEEALVAIGRKPNVAALGLASTSLVLDGHGVPRFDRSTGQCGDAPVFIAGDAMDDAPLLHEATSTGRIAGANSVVAEPQDKRRFVNLSVVFCEPQIALVGETHADLVARGASFDTGSVDWSGQGRALVMNEAIGRLVLYAERGTCRFLGAEMFGPRSEHIAYALGIALTEGLTVPQMIEAPIYHPTFEEGLITAMSNCLRTLGRGDGPLPDGLSSGPGG